MGKDGKNPQNDFSNLEQTIEAEVNRIVETVGGTVQDVLQGVSETLRQNGAEGMQRVGDSLRSLFGEMQNNAAHQRKSPPQPGGYVQHPYAPQRGQPKRAQPQRAQPMPHLHKVQEWKKHLTHPERGAGHVLSILGTVFGGIVGGGLCIATMVTAIVETTGAVALWVPQLLGFLALGFVLGAVHLTATRRQRKRLERYAALLHGRAFCPVEELATAVGRSVKFTRRDLKHMVQKGLFRSACLSPDGKKLFAGTQAYREYEGANLKDPVEPLLQPEQELQTEGTQFLRELRAQKTHIEDAAVLEQVERIDQKTQSIFAWVKKNPSSASAVRRFTSYYLPTVLKLLKTYNEVDSHAENSTVASQIQDDIVGILHTVNIAFSNLQDSMLADTAMSTSAEISALQTVLAQEGLTDEGMHASQLE